MHSCGKGHKDTCSYAGERRYAWSYVVMCDASYWDFEALPLGRPPDRDDRHAIGYRSPRIDEDMNKHHLMISMGTHTPLSLLHYLQAQTSWVLSLGTFIMSNRTPEAHSRQLVGTQSIQGETSQWCYLVRARTDECMFREVTMSELQGALSVGQREVLCEHEVQGMGRPH